MLWRGLAEIAEKYIRKGSQLYIEGKIRTRSYEDQNKVRRYTTEIYADNLELLGRRADTTVPTTQTTEQTQQTTQESNTANGNNSADDLPF